MPLAALCKKHGWRFADAQKGGRVSAHVKDCVEELLSLGDGPRVTVQGSLKERKGKDKHFWLGSTNQR
jgi:uncharacterized protein YdeI (BOF family)